MATFLVIDGNLEALDLIPGSIEDSIEKWRCLHNLADAGELVWDGAGATCALCRGYQYCIGCPVYKFTGAPDCKDTPYEDYFEAIRQGDVQQARASAAEMVEFLEKLLQTA